jgi:hypothetical protein
MLEEELPAIPGEKEAALEVVAAVPPEVQSWLVRGLVPSLAEKKSRLPKLTRSCGSELSAPTLMSATSCVAPVAMLSDQSSAPWVVSKAVKYYTGKEDPQSLE